MTIIDSHAHIDQYDDIEAVIKRSIDANVSDVVAMSVDLQSMVKVIELAKRFTSPCIHPALGIHPGMVTREDHAEALVFLKNNIVDAKAIGETGLDYWYKWVRKNEEERQRQKNAFLIHLELAKEYQMPIVIHSRGAWKECLAMAQTVGVSHALFHWYSGPIDVMTKILDAGYYVSTSPSVGYSVESQTAMKAAPLDRILIETDAPVRYRTETADYVAEPKDVWKTLTALSVLKQLDEATVLEHVNLNAKKFFRI